MGRRGLESGEVGLEWGAEKVKIHLRFLDSFLPQENPREILYAVNSVVSVQ
jgi:hypothetical protein